MIEILAALEIAQKPQNKKLVREPFSFGTFPKTFIKHLFCKELFVSRMGYAKTKTWKLCY